LAESREIGSTISRTARDQLRERSALERGRTSPLAASGKKATTSSIASSQGSIEPPPKLGAGLKAGRPAPHACPSQRDCRPGQDIDLSPGSRWQFSGTIQASWPRVAMEREGDFHLASAVRQQAVIAACLNGTLDLQSARQRGNEQRRSVTRSLRIKCNCVE
jgi:hypothetical protein